MNEVIKNEFINRYVFLYENVDLILMPYVKKTLDNKVYLDIYKEFLDDLELFLLSDIPFEESNFYKKITALSNNPEVVEKCKNVRTYLIELRKKKYIDSFDVKTILQTLRNYILGQYNRGVKDKKLLALDEYFRFNRYRNSSSILKGGAILGYEDLGIFCERLRNEDIPFRFKRSYLLDSNFISYIADKKNHYEENNSIFTEDEKQEVYLKTHPGTVPWNKKILKKDN